MSDSTAKPARKLDVLSLAGLRRKKKKVEKYASFHRRMLAATIDSAIIMIAIGPPLDVVFSHIFGPVALDMEALNRQAAAHPEATLPIVMHALLSSGYLLRWCCNFLAQMLALGLITGWCWHRWSATPGKMLLRMKIVDADSEQPMTMRQIVLRLLGYALAAAALCLGFFWIGIDKRRQGWHDKLAHTVVIHIPKSTAAPPSGDPAVKPQDDQSR